MDSGRPESTLSKKRYYDIEERFRALIVTNKAEGEEEVLGQLMMTIRDVMGFDPKATRYTPQLGKRMGDLRKARVERLIHEAELRGEAKR